MSHNTVNTSKQYTPLETTHSSIPHQLIHASPQFHTALVDQAVAAPEVAVVVVVMQLLVHTLHYTLQAYSRCHLCTCLAQKYYTGTLQYSYLKLLEVGYIISFWRT